MKSSKYFFNFTRISSNFYVQTLFKSEKVIDKTINIWLNLFTLTTKASNSKNLSQIDSQTKNYWFHNFGASNLNSSIGIFLKNDQNKGSITYPMIIWETHWESPQLEVPNSQNIYNVKNSWYVHLITIQVIFLLRLYAALVAFMKNKILHWPVNLRILLPICDTPTTLAKKKNFTIKLGVTIHTKMVI